MVNTIVGPKVKARVKWDVNALDFSPEKKERLQYSAAKKLRLDPNQVEVKENYLTKEHQENTEAIAAETIDNIKDPSFQLHLMKRYLDESGVDPSSYDFEEIKTIDSMVNNSIDFTQISKANVFYIRRIWFSNFLSYGLNQEFDFTTCKGFVSISGQPANQCGKTTFAIDLLDYLLHGKTESGKINKYEDVFNTQLPNENVSRVKGEIVINNKHYIIERVLTKTKKQPKNEVHFWEVKADNKVTLYDNDEASMINNLECKSVTDTNAKISEMVGNEADYLQVAVANAENLSSLISLKDTDRGKLLSRWLGLNIVTEKAEKAKTLYTSVKDTFLNGFSQEKLKAENDEMTIMISNNEEEIKNLTTKANDAANSIREFEIKKEELLLSKTPIDSDLDKYDIMTLTQERKKVIDKGIKKKAELESKKAEFEGLQNVTFDKEALDNNRNLEKQYNSLIFSHKNEIAKYRKEIEENKSSEYCRYCGAKLSDVSHDHIEKINGELQAKIDALSKELETYNGYMKTINDNIKILESNKEMYNKRNLLEVGIQAIESELVNLRTKATDIKKLMDRLEQNKQAIENNNHIDADINVLKVNITEMTGIYNSTSLSIANLKKDNERMVADINRNNGYIAKLEVDEKAKNNWNTYLKLIGKDGISKLVLKEILPRINHELNRLLDEAADFNVEVTINDQNDTSFYLIQNGARRNLTSGSGYEQTIAALALRVILVNLCTCAKPCYLVLDEVFYGVARENYDKVRSFIEKIKPFYNAIYQITHIQDIQDWGDQEICVRKVDGISYVSPVRTIM